MTEPGSFRTQSDDETDFYQPSPPTSRSPVSFSDQSSQPFAVDLSPDPSPVPASGDFPEFVLAIRDRGVPRSYKLTGDRYELGRDDDLSIRLDSPFVSRYHAYMVRVPYQLHGSGFTYCLVDGDREGHASTNGVFVDGQRIATHYLSSGNVIFLGPEVKAYFYSLLSS